MKLTFKRTEIANAISKLAPAIPTKTANEIYRNVHVSADSKMATLTASDGEVTVSIEVPVSSDSLTGETFLLPFTRFSRIAKETSGEDLQVTVKENAATISSGGSEFNLQLEDATLFTLPKADALPVIGTVGGKLLLQAFEQTVFCCDEASTRYALGGVNFDWGVDALDIAATDSRRLAVVRISGKQPKEPMAWPVIPARAIRAAMSSIDVNHEVQLSWTDRLIQFDTPGVTIFGRVVEGRFPAYRDVFPREFEYSLTIPRPQLVSAVRQSMIVTNEESRGIELEFDNGELHLTGVGKDIGKSRVSLPIQWQHDLMRMSLDPRFFEAALKACTGESVDLLFNDPNSPFLIEDGSYRHVIMPLSQE